MSSTAPADTVPTGSHTKAADQHSSEMASPEVMEQPRSRNPGYDNDDNEDPATQAASENLKHASISEKEPPESLETSNTMEGDSTAPEQNEGETTRPITPEAAEPSDAQDEEMKERISSPKKKRGREQDDEIRDPEAAGNVEEVGASPNGTAVNGRRTTRLAPEKKRHRDASVDIVTITETAIDTKVSRAGCLEVLFNLVLSVTQLIYFQDPLVPEAKGIVKTAATITDPAIISPELSSRPVFGSGMKEKAQTSATAFANSGFGTLAASSTSGFAALAASKPSVFGSGTTNQLSGFGAMAGSNPVIPDTSKVKLGFGGTVTEPLGSTLGGGFGNIGTTGFGVLGSGFGGGFTGFKGGSGPTLSSFATSSAPDIVGAEKPAKAFGAPESDEEADSEDDDDESRGGAASDEEENVSVDEKKKHRVSRGIFTYYFLSILLISATD
jgi:hypothetical protein